MRLEELNRLISEPGFWDDADKANATMAEIAGLKNGIEGFDNLQRQYDDIGALIEMAEEENDESMISEISDELEKYKKDFVFKNKKNKSDLGNGNSPFDASFSYRSQDYST